MRLKKPLQKKEYKLNKNKKAQYFMVTLFIIVIISLTALYFVFLNKYNSYQLKMGQRQVTLIAAEQNAEKSLLYLDCSAWLSGQQAYYDALRANGRKESFLGYSIWNHENKDNYPTENSIKEEFIVNMKKNLRGYASELNIPFEYDISVIKNKNALEVTGKASSRISSVLGLNKKKKKEPITLTPIPEYSYPESYAKKAKEIYKNYGNFIEKYSGGEISQGFLVAVIAAESNGNKNAVSPTGCAGLTQFCYNTAKEYKNIFKRLTMCKCSGPTYKNNCKCSPENDDRFDPEKSIEASALYYKKLISRFDGPAKYECSIASYNIGTGPVISVIKRLDSVGKHMPLWEEIANEIKREDLKKYRPYSSWSDSEIDKKINEVKSYVKRVMQYKKAFESSYATIKEKTSEEKKLGQKKSSKNEAEERKKEPDKRKNAGSIIENSIFFGAYSITPVFSLSLNYDISRINRIRLDAKNLVRLAKECMQKNEKECVKKTMSELKLKNKGWEEDCPEDNNEKMLVLFVEELEKCVGLPEESHCRIEFSDHNIDDGIHKIFITEKSGSTEIYTKKKAYKTGNIIGFYDPDIGKEYSIEGMHETLVLEISYKNKKAESITLKTYHETPTATNTLVDTNIDFQNSLFLSRKGNRLILSGKDFAEKTGNKYPGKYKTKVFCITTKEKALAYDTADNKVKERNIKYSFALEFS